ncbi:hypothetical protein ACQB60_15880 [Actinomycetota bacterium Odt1-20B]
MTPNVLVGHAPKNGSTAGTAEAVAEMPREQGHAAAARSASQVRGLRDGRRAVPPRQRGDGFHDFARARPRALGPAAEPGSASATPGEE